MRQQTACRTLSTGIGVDVVRGSSVRADGDELEVIDVGSTSQDAHIGDWVSRVISVVSVLIDRCLFVGTDHRAVNNSAVSGQVERRHSNCSVHLGAEALDGRIEKEVHVVAGHDVKVPRSRGGLIEPRCSTVPAIGGAVDNNSGVLSDGNMRANPFVVPSGQ